MNVLLLLGIRHAGKSGKIPGRGGAILQIQKGFFYIRLELLALKA